MRLAWAFRMNEDHCGIRFLMLFPLNTVTGTKQGQEDGDGPKGFITHTLDNVAGPLSALTGP